MKLGFVGLGRMGMNMTLRLLRSGHQVVAHNHRPGKVDEAKRAGARPAYTLDELVAALEPPRVVWAMIPAGPPVDELLDRLIPQLERGDLVVDGGNSNFRDSRRRAERLGAAGLEFGDSGSSGGIWGRELGYCI